MPRAAIFKREAIVDAADARRCQRAMLSNKMMLLRRYYGSLPRRYADAL